MTNEDRRRRCLTCCNFGMNECNIYGCNESSVEKCDFINVNLKSLDLSDPEVFMLRQNPIVYLRYQNYKRRTILPKPGDIVSTLVSGFGGGVGMVRMIKGINDKYIEVCNLNGTGKYASYIDEWWNQIYIIN